jgi:hypothetical protein
MASRLSCVGSGATAIDRQAICDAADATALLHASPNAIFDGGILLIGVQTFGFRKLTGY